MPRELFPWISRTHLFYHRRFDVEEWKYLEIRVCFRNGNIQKGFNFLNSPIADTKGSIVVDSAVYVLFGWPQ